MEKNGKKVVKNNKKKNYVNKVASKPVVKKPEVKSEVKPAVQKTSVSVKEEKASLVNEKKVLNVCLAAVLVICLAIMAFLLGLCYKSLFGGSDGYNNAPVVEDGGTVYVLNYYETAWSTLYLDDAGNVYYHLEYTPTTDDTQYDRLMTIKQNEVQYVNENGEVFYAKKLNEDSISEIYYADDDSNGFGYFGLLTEDGNLYLINEGSVINNGRVTVVKSSVLTNIIYMGVEVDDDTYTLSAYALRDDYEKVYLNGIGNN